MCLAKWISVSNSSVTMDRYESKKIYEYLDPFCVADETLAMLISRMQKRKDCPNRLLNLVAS